MINWDLLSKTGRENNDSNLVQAPFIPSLKNDCDVEYFDRSFTSDRNFKSILKSGSSGECNIDQSVFKSFNYVNFEC